MRSTLKPDVAQADKLARAFVFARDGYRCLCCATEANLEWAHITTRRNLHLRWEPSNALTLCHRDHQFFTGHPGAFRQFIADLYGPDRFAALSRLQTAAERRGDKVDVAAVIAGFREHDLTPSESVRYHDGDW